VLRPPKADAGELPGADRLLGQRLQESTLGSLGRAFSRSSQPSTSSESLIVKGLDFGTI
jgi:hypothetical protein